MAEERVQRRLAAILAADVVGYSRLMGEDEARTLDRVKALRTEVLDPETTSFGGRIFKTTGDGFLAEFPSATDAVQCAIEIQRALVGREAGLPEEKRIVLRAGLSLGDVMVDGEDLYGNGVNVAARMEALAEPGGICMSGNVHEHVRGLPGLAFEDLGSQSVKNITEPVRAFAIGTAASAVATDSAPPLSNKPSIAVLPFENISGDPEQEYFADGIVEEIITGLARIRWLTVIARNSTFAYKGKSPDIRNVGRELAVRYVLEGSVRKAADRVRITAQLVEAETGGHLWADRFDGSLADVFDLQDQITAGVVGAIEPSVRRSEIERAKRKRPDNLSAYDFYLRAIEHAYAFTPAGRTEALALLDKAFALDPGYAEAHGVAAWCRQQRFRWESGDPTDKEAALRHAEAVAAARTDDATALSFAAMVTGVLGNDNEAALAMIERALAENPSSAIAYNVGAVINGRLGRYDRCGALAQQSLRLSPLDPMRYMAENGGAIAKLAAGENESAMDSLRRALVVNPDFPPARTLEAVCLVRLGRLDEARASVRRLLDRSPGMRAADIRQRIVSIDSPMCDAIIDDLRVAGLPK